MKSSLSRGFKCLKCFVIFYLVFLCILGLGVGVFASYLFIFREEGHVFQPRNIILYFLIVSSVLTILSTSLGWWSVRKKNITLLKFDNIPHNRQQTIKFAVLQAVTAILEIAGCIWCSVSLPEVSEEVKSHMKMKFDNIITFNSDRIWWNNLQVKLQCCGFQGPTDYHSANSIPFSCCGSDPDDPSAGSCSFVWQKGCSNAVEKQTLHDLVLLSIITLSAAFLRIPGICLSCCFAQKMSKERL